ncbi:TadE/TadG family type IV pilus assembly protein [Vibrio quintilis]|uniref:TadE-like protein n=1 Tax=Vibrio quintilis TaxID=1117707 RepID=A0A1M7YS72_9VIBR|nr:TadE/TadG family type IV pilus assembly protein [Vibrio quintilis]SHO55474.1 TadE-like protein [Vibrio quintilis]
MRLRKQQSGVSILEFTLLATSVLLVLFSVIEMGRYVYSLQMANDITRKVARMGVVCHVSDKDDLAALAIQNYAPAGFTASNLIIEYLDQSGQAVSINAGMSSDDYNDAYATIKFVRVRVSNYQYQLIGFLSFLAEGGVILLPDMETTLPIESLGVIRPTLAHPESRHTDC